MKFSDTLPTDCPSCGQPGLELCISAPAIQFKGAGWYVNDYARKSSTPASNSSKGESSEASAGKESSSSSSPSPESGSSSTGSSAPASAPASSESK
jgi:predicted nucleic acid-binding Zn ribbon protein